MQRRSRVSYEKGLMSDMILQHVGNWLEWNRSALTTPRDIPKTLAVYVPDRFPAVNLADIKIGIEYANSVGAKFHQSDIVLLSSTVGHMVLGEIWYNFQHDQEFCTCVSVWAFLNVSTCGVYATYRYEESPRLFPSNMLRSVCIYRCVGANRLIILPLSYRLDPS